MSDQFHFTVTDLARFLGKSAVTIRTWERQGLVEIPRDSGGDRKLTTKEVSVIAIEALMLGRITPVRLDYVEATMTLLELIERENRADKNRSSGSTRRRKV